MKVRIIILCLGFFLICRPATGGERIEITFVKSWGIKGSEPGRFNEPYGIAVDDGGFVYVTDVRNARVQKFTGEGEFVLEWGGKGSDLFQKPVGIAVDSRGVVYVTDYDSDRIQKFDDRGKFISSWGRNGDDEGEFDAPNDIAVDSKGNIYVTDFYNHRIQKFDKDGKFLKSWGKEGKVDKLRSVLSFIFREEKAGEFNYPAKIAVSNGKIYVSDAYNNRVQVFSDEGGYIFQFGGMGLWKGRFRISSGIAIDTKGNIFVADFYNNRIHIFDREGKIITSFGRRGIGSGEFRGPTGVAVSRKGDIYVTDWGNHRVQMFRNSN